MLGKLVFFCQKLIVRKVSFLDYLHCARYTDIHFLMYKETEIPLSTLLRFFHADINPHVEVYIHGTFSVAIYLPKKIYYRN